MNDLPGRLRRFLDSYPASRYWIGYSGGVDSHVLLHLCARLKSERGGVFAALHIDHGLHPDSAKWRDHCRAVCERLDLPFLSIPVDARPEKGESPEEAARTARYRAFESVLQADEAVLLAHHQDDQAETVMLQLMRGAGPAGLSGMGVEAVLGAGKLLRPFLEIPRQLLLEYARAHRLTWIEDPGNQTADFDRNYLRHHVFPLLRRRWPAAARTVSRSATHCAESEALLAAWGGDLLRTLRDEEGRLDLQALSEHSLPAQRWLLRAWLRELGWRPPPAVVLERILTEVIPAREDANPRIAWAGVELRRYRRKLYALPRFRPVDPGWCVTWNGTAPLSLPDGRILEAVEAKGAGIDAGQWRRARITVRYREGGEQCFLPGRRGRRTLKKLFQERGMPPWERKRTPLVFLNGELAAVGDLWVCAGFCASMGDPGVQLRWIKH